MSPSVCLRRLPRRARLAVCVWLAGVMLALLAWPTLARADSSADVLSPRIVLSTPDGDRGPLRLAPRPGEGGAPPAFEAEFVVANRGSVPLMVTRIAPRSDEDDVRLPPRLAIRYADAPRSGKTGEVESTAASIAPGGERRVRVTWTPAAGERVMQLVGHVVVTSSDADAGEVAMGIRADRPRTLGFVAEHPLLFVVLLPLAGALFLGLLPVFGAGRSGWLRARERGTVRAVAAGVTGAQALFALYVFRSFDGEMTRAAGNDGYQFIERAVWIRPLDVEFFVGVDGVSVAMLLLGSIVSFAGALASFATRDRTRGYFVLYLLLSSASACVFLALDLVLFFVAWAAMLFALYLLVRLWGPRSAPRERAASKFLAVAVVGSAFLLVAIVALHQASSRTFLVDGTPAAHSYALPELMRVAYNTRGLVLFGLPFVKVAWVLLLVGFAVPTPMFPLHTYLPDLVAEAPGPVSAMVVGAVLPTGLYGILRVGFAVLPEGSRWASGTLVAFGAVGVAYGAFAALAENDLKRFVAYASLSHAGLALVGIGSLTPQGMAGALVLAFGHGLAASLLVFAVDALEGRCRTRDREHFGGLGKKAPLLTVLFAVAFLTGLGLPGTVTFWGTLLPLLGAFPLHQGFTSFVALSLVVVGLAHLRPLERLCFGVFPARWEKSAALSPFGGKLPDVSPREVAVVAPLLVLVLLLGLWPEPLLSRLSGGVHDAASLVNPPGPDQVALAL